MIVPLLSLVLAAPALPKGCEQPVLRDVAPLKELANLDSAFSAGLDSVATWCFDSAGAWNGGAQPQKGKKPPVDPQATGDCARAIASCEASHDAVKNKAGLRELAGNALLDFDRPYRGARYTPKRSGLRESPSEAANCQSKTRSELFNQAQSRMDLARLVAMIQNEYANYKTWMFAEGLKCANELSGKKPEDKTVAAHSVDSPYHPEAPFGSPAAKDAGTKPGQSGVAAVQPGVGVGIANAGNSSATLGTTGSVGTVAPLGPMAAGGTFDAGRANPSTLSGSGASAAVTGTGSGMGSGSTVSLGGMATPDAGLRAANPSNLGGAGTSAAISATGSGMGATNAITLGTVSAPGANDPERIAVLQGDWALKWKYLAKWHQQQESDRDYTLGFLASKELRACDCNRVNPSAIARAIEKKEGGETGLALLRDEDAANTKCALCQLDAFGPWRARADQKCKQMNTLSDLDIDKLAKSDDAAGIPPRCFDDTRALRVELAKARAALAAKTDAGSALLAPTAAAAVIDAGVLVASTANVPVSALKPPDAGATAYLKDVNGMTFYAPPGSNTVTAPVTGPGAPTGPGVDPGFTAPQAWAPIPQREDGRYYVRLFMSSACVAEIEPGPLQARTGDLLLLQYDAKYVQVKSPCGGLAEVYFGREARPRVSENFSGKRGLRFEFQKQKP